MNEYGTAGTSEAFIMPKKQYDAIVSEAGGDLRAIEDKLNLNTGSLDQGDVMAVYIKREDIQDLRIPSGREAGANNQWIPGGYTSNGVPEAVADLSESPFTVINVR